MKLEPRLPHLPSLAELIEHPLVRGAAERINRSTLAHRAAGFLEEIRESLADRGARLELPGLTQLAERLSRRLLGGPSGSGSAINATGVVVGHGDWTPPLAEEALAAAMQLAGEYHATADALAALVARETAALAGAESAAIFATFEAATAVALAAVGAHHEAVVVGADSIHGAVDWPRVAQLAGVACRLNERPGTPSRFVVVRSPEASLDATPGEIRRRFGEATCVVEAAPSAGFADPERYGLSAVPTVAARLSDGADLVVVDGAGLLGGPACGVVFGRKQLIEQVLDCPLARLAVCSPLALAALGGTAAVVRSWGDDFALHLPAWQLLSAPLENLEQRARRLAPQIEALDANLQATPVRREAAWLRCGDAEATAATWTIEVRPREGSIAVLEGRARTAVPPLISAVEDGAAVVDLRSVFARWDRRLVEVLGGGAPSRSWSKIDVDDGGVK